MKMIMEFYGQQTASYNLYTDSQAAEYLATQPNFTTASRSIDLRFHAVKQSYLQGDCRIGGVKSKQNPADILTKSLQPPLHEEHCQHLKPRQDPLTSRQQNSINISQCPTTMKRRLSPETNDDNQDNETQRLTPSLHIIVSVQARMLA